ncbi:MAG: S-layer family protein, partial [Cyanobacteria bacterium J06621_15]
SNIDGLTKANGSANLFLINPAGIVFGENSRLDIGGSFFGSTAESLLFEDGFNYSAIDSQQTPLLTISVPVGLQMGTQAGEIINRSQAVDSNSGVNVGLQVTPGESISLIGGEINLSGGNITASGGIIELGSVATGSFVGITPQTQALDYTEVEKFADINLTNGSIVSASGEGGGRIRLRGKNITLNNNSVIRSETSGNLAGQDLVIRGSEQIFINADSYNSALRTSLSTNTLVGSEGNGGNLVLEAPLIQIKNRAWLTSDTRGAGDAGDITIRANTVEAVSAQTDDFSFIRIASRVRPGATGNGGNFTVNAQSMVAADALIGTNTSGEGNAGNVAVEVDSLELIGGSQLQTLTFGNGNAGNMVVRASESINLSGVTDFIVIGQGVASSGLFTSAEPNSTGNGGSMIVETQQLRIAEGGKIAANALGIGNGGDINIRARDIQVSDAVIDFVGTLSGILASTESSGTGNSGNINIETETLRVFDGGQILTSAFSNGEAGNINISGSEIEVTGVSNDNSFVSRIAALSESDLKAGTININTNNLRVENTAEINVGNQGSGNAGNLNVIANNISLKNGGILQAEVNGGEKGNINLNINDSVILRDGSSIFANATGSSSGGNINIDSPVIAGFENSDIIANAVDGNGGNIELTTQGIFGLEFREELTLGSDITASSEFGINGTVKINNIGIDPGSGLIELPSELKDSSQQIATGCSSSSNNSFVATGRGGVPQNPKQQISSNSSWSDIRDLSIYRKYSNNAVENTQISNKPAIIEATGFIQNLNGEIELVALENKPFNAKQAVNCSGNPA